MSEIRYCTTGCTRRDGDQNRPVQVDPPNTICNRCADQIDNWLKTIPDLYATLPTFALPGAAETNPESVATKRATVPAPIRLEIIDLLDTRLGRKWLGTATTDDRRGVLGTLHAIAREIIDERELTIPPQPHVTDTAAFIRRHLDWLRNQTWASETHAELKQLHRSLSNAVGDYKRPPVGRCHVIPEDTTEPCGGGLHASTYGGVRCGRCGATWDAAHLRQLGLAQASAEPA